MEISEEVQEYIDELEVDAKEIEDHIEKFCEGIFSRKVKTKTGSLRHEWNTPQGETKEAQRKAREGYEKWYTAAIPLIEEYFPEKLEDFERSYSSFKKYISLNHGAYLESDGLYNKLIDTFDEQRNFAKSVSAKIQAQKLRARRQLSAHMVRDEMQRARELFNDDFIRSAGVIAAVALERHLLTMCENSESVTEYEPNHGISRLAQTLYESEVIDKTIWNDLKALASIRETCAHPEEPEKEAVRRLINDAEEFIRTHET